MPPAPRAAAAALLLLFAAQGLWSAAAHSGTADELAAHGPAGLLFWRSGAHGGGLSNLPLGQLWVAAVPGLLGLPTRLFTDDHLLLLRLPNLGLGVAAAAAVGALARRLGGDRAGLIALGLCALDRNLLAHAALATLDLPIAALAALTLALAGRLAERPSAGGFAGLGLLLGAALATKVQGLLLLPLAAAALFARGRAPPAAALLAPAVAWLGLHLAHQTPPFADERLLPAAWTQTLGRVLAHAQKGRGAWFLGGYDADGHWAYFPVMLLVKTPLLTLGLAAAGLLRRPTRAELLLAGLPLAAFLGLAMASEVNIGLRHALPAVPFLIVLAGLGGARLLQARRGPALLAGGLLLAGIEAARTAPHHLSWFNLLAGGPGGGHRVSVDSDVDWGQHEGELAAFLEASPEPWVINPQEPTGGPVLLSENARHGLMRGGPAVMAWLDGRAPTARVAQTWHAYDLPGEPAPDPGRAARAAVAGHLVALAAERAALDDPALTRALFHALVATAAHGSALAVARGWLERHPDDEAALAMAGELVVRRKMGAAELERTPGLRPPEAEPRALRPSALRAAARDAGLQAPLAAVFDAMGDAWDRAGEPRRAIPDWVFAAELRPADPGPALRAAWALSTAADPAARDGAGAEALLRAAARDGGWTGSPRFEDTLGAALAAMGRLDEARAAAARAAAGFEAEGDARRAAAARGRAWAGP